MSLLLRATALFGSAVLFAACGGTTVDPTSYATSADEASSIAHQVAKSAKCGKAEDLGPLPADPKVWGLSCWIDNSNFQIDVFGNERSAHTLLNSLDSTPHVFRKTYLVFPESDDSGHLSAFSDSPPQNSR